MNGVFVVRVEAVSNGKGKDKQAAPQNAYINVYTTASPESLARRVALREIAEAGWHCVNVEEISWHSRDSYSGEEVEREYLEQALTDGVVLVVHSFPDESKH